AYDRPYHRGRVSALLLACERAPVEAAQPASRDRPPGRDVPRAGARQRVVSAARRNIRPRPLHGDPRGRRRPAAAEGRSSLRSDARNPARRLVVARDAFYHRAYSSHQRCGQGGVLRLRESGWSCEVPTVSTPPTMTTGYERNMLGEIRLP